MTEITLLAHMTRILAALRSGVLIPAPGLAEEQQRALNAELDAMRAHIDRIVGTAAATPIVPKMFTRPAEPSAGDRGKAAVALAASITFGEAARRIFEAHRAKYPEGCPEDLIFARYNAIRAYESTCELFEVVEPDLRSEVESLVRRMTRRDAVSEINDEPGEGQSS
ncbi:hypothetical protein [Tahibacter caeni]|uniref:hypothetical protein n=1 Tax=Tahibacter caeni TaxID=1453545 RepID=UPI0021495970|nr:hypothetical protein [Tahibacter caeni]